MKKLIFILLLILSSFILMGQTSDVHITWNASTDNVGVTGYNVWLDGEYYGTTSDTTFVLMSLEPAVYLVGVSAFDAAGNESEKSESLLVDTRGDIIPPSVPEHLMIVVPNPTYGNFVLRFENEVKDNSVIQIITSAGRLEYQRVILPADAGYEETFEMENFLVPGLYIIALIENNVRVGHTYVVITNTNEARNLYANIN